MRFIDRSAPWAVFSAVLLAAACRAGEPVPAADPHAQHHLAVHAEIHRREAGYEVPDLKVLRQDGTSVDLRAELDDGRPVILNFIYTSCTTICPMTSQVFSQFQRQLGPQHEPVHLVSVSIDPEQDTPARLRDYAAQFEAGPGWDHYTGTMAASVAIQRAFDVYRGDKMSHTAVTLLRAAPGQPWIRLDGFASAGDLLAERQAWLARPAAIVAR